MSHSVPDTTRQELLDPDAFPEYLIHSPREIAKLLQTLMARRALLNAHVDGRGTLFVTAVLEVSEDARTLLLDASPDDAMNDRVAAAHHVVCTTRLDGIRIQFSVPTPERVMHDGHVALRAALPDRMLRLQRRESYRLAVPTSDPVTCTIPVPGGDPVERSVTLRVLDISNGGVALLLVPSDGITLQPGMRFENCTLAIPEGGTANVTLRVRNVFNANVPDQPKRMRVGCEFVDIPARFATQIQRYIFKVERERRSRGA